LAESGLFEKQLKGTIHTFVMRAIFFWPHKCQWYKYTVLVNRNSNIL